MKIIGITGNSGSGKTTVSKIFRKHNSYIFDADEINTRILLKDGLAYKSVVNEFGICILDENENIDKKKLGKIVFEDKNKLSKLVDINHKYIVEYILKKLHIIKNDNYRFIVIDAALLIESGLNKYVDEVWLVYSSYENRLKRVIDRDNLNYEDVVNRFGSQTSFHDMEKFANCIISNDQNLENLNHVVELLIGNI